MLKEFCTVSENEVDDFVGLRFVDGNPQVVFPRGFRLPDDEKLLRRDVFRLLAAIQKFSGRHEGERPKNDMGEQALSFPVLSYQYIIKDYLAHGYYTEKETNYIVAPRGKINWKRTIQKEDPQLDNGNIIYLDFIVSRNRINSNNLLTKIHEYCVYESFYKIGWLFISSDALPKKPSIKLNRKLFLSVLRKELSRTFNDNKKRLFQCMINIISQEEESLDELPQVTFGVERFEYVWEGMINYVFGEDNREMYFPHAHWHIVSNHGFSVQSSELRPDTIAKVEDKIFILDAKYYKYGITRNPLHLPATDSIQKQITYGEFVKSNGLADADNIYSAFLMPYNMGEGEQPYKFVSVGTADWKPYNEYTENYNYVIGILVDTRTLLETYAKHNYTEIVSLCSLIEESLQFYRDDAERR